MESPNERTGILEIDDGLRKKKSKRKFLITAGCLVLMLILVVVLAALLKKTFWGMYDIQITANILFINETEIDKNADTF